MTRYEYVDGSSAKFWQYEVRQSDLVVEYGRIGGKAQTSNKTFSSAQEAERAAEKLVKEKTGKGYRLVAEAASTQSADAPAPRATGAAQSKAGGQTPPSSQPSSSGDLPEWLSEAQFDKVVAGLKKKSKASPTEKIEAVVGSGDVGTWGREAERVDATIAIIIDRGLWPENSLEEVLVNAMFGWAFMRPETLLGLIKHPAFDEMWAEAALLRLGTAAPHLLASEHDAELPPALARQAPLARRRLGLSQEPLSEALADELARMALRGRGGLGGQIDRRGRCLAERYFESYGAYRDYIVETFGIKDWDARIAAQAKKGEFSEAWQAEPLFLQASLEELPGLLDSAMGTDGEILMRWLEARQDDPAELARIAMSMQPGEPTVGNRYAFHVREALAVMAGAGLAATGKPIPPELDQCVWFLDNLPPARLNPAYSRALAAWPKERVHARVRELLVPPVEPEDFDSSDDLPLGVPARVAVGLGAHPDDELTRQLLDGLTWPELNEQAACIGRLDIKYLPELLARRERESSKSKHWELAIQTMLVNAAMRSGQAFAAEHDVHFAPQKCHDKTAWNYAVHLLPGARKDAYFLAWAELNPFEFQPLLHLVSDQALDRIVGLMFAQRHIEEVNVTYPAEVSFEPVSRGLAACGPRVIPFIEKHYRASGGDAKARELLAVMPIQPELHAELVG